MWKFPCLIIILNLLQLCAVTENFIVDKRKMVEIRCMTKIIIIHRWENQTNEYMLANTDDNKST